MAFTYDNTLPSARDRARFELNDRVQATAIFADEEIDATLARYTWGRALATLARTAAENFLRQANEWSEADVKRKYSDRAEFYKNLAEKFEKLGDPDVPPAVDETSGSAFVRRLEEPDLTLYRFD